MLCWWLMLTQEAHAYIDPGTGSFVFQLMMAAFMGAVFTAKQWWKVVAGVFKRRSDDSRKSGS